MYDFSAVARVIEDTFKTSDCPPVEGSLPLPWVDLLHHEALVALNSWAQAPYEDKHHMFRAYAGTSLDFALHERVLCTPHPPLDWLASQPSRRPVTLQISDINTWNDRLSYLFALLREALDPSLSHFAHDFRLGLFIGTGGHTPFGIHADGADMTLLHVPLIGSGKTMHFQSEDGYLRTHGHKRPTLDMNKGLPAMTPVAMRRGRFVFFRGDWFHVATYTSLSMSLILNIKRDRMQNLRPRVQNHAAFRDRVMQTARDVCNTGAQMSDAEPAAARHLRMQTHSAAGFLPPRPKAARASGAISRVAPFPIFLDTAAGTNRIIARGHVADIPIDAATQEAVADLNADLPVPLSALGTTSQRAQRVAEFLLTVGAVE